MNIKIGRDSLPGLLYCTEHLIEVLNVRGTFA